MKKTILTFAFLMFSVLAFGQASYKAPSGGIVTPTIKGQATVTTDDACTSGVYWIRPVAGTTNSWRFCNNGTLGTLGASTGHAWSVSALYSGIPTSGTYLIDYYIPTFAAPIGSPTITIPANCAGSTFNSKVAATGSTALTIKKNGTTICTATFAASGTVATWSTGGSATTLTTGDEITVTVGSTDATLSGITGQVVGTY